MDCNYNFQIELAPNGIPLCAKSIGKSHFTICCQLKNSSPKTSAENKFRSHAKFGEKKAGISSNLFLKLAKSIQKLDCNYNFPIDLTHNGIPFDVTQSEK